MAWSSPKSWATGYKVLASDMNTFVSDNDAALRAGGIAIASQAANDVLYASSSTQLARLGGGTSGYFLQTNGTGSAPAWAEVSLAANVLQKTAAYTVLTSDGDDVVIKCHMTAGAAAFAITLYASSASTVGNRVTVLKETDDNHKVTVTPDGSETITNAPGQTTGFELFALADHCTLINDGANWYVTSDHQSIHGLVRLNANQTVASGACRRVKYDTEVYDTFGGWNNAGNFEFTVPRYGYYQISAAAYIDGPNDSSCMTQIRISNVSTRINRFRNMYGGNLPVGVTLQVDTDQYVQVFSQHNRGSDTELVAGLADTYFSIDYIGQ